MKFTPSPASLNKHEQCGRNYYGSYISYEIPFVEGPQAKRGTELHGVLEEAIEFGWDKIKWPDKDCVRIAKESIDTIWKLKYKGWTVHVEDKLATNRTYDSVDYHAKPPYGFVRCRTDWWASHPDYTYVILGDWKTGKTMGTDLQIAANAACLAAKVNAPKVYTIYTYIDMGFSVDKWVTIDRNIQLDTDPELCKGYDLYSLIKAHYNLREAYRTDIWVERKNDYCKYCPLDCKTFTGKKFKGR